MSKSDVTESDIQRLKKSFLILVILGISLALMYVNRSQSYYKYNINVKRLSVRHSHNINPNILAQQLDLLEILYLHLSYRLHIFHRLKKIFDVECRNIS